MMGDYTEHLISMAGGDGEPDLDQIQARITDCQTYKFGMRNADKLAHEDAPNLLALVRDQAAKLEKAKADAWDEGHKHYGRYFSPNFSEFGVNPYRAALTATEGA